MALQATAVPIKNAPEHQWNADKLGHRVTLRSTIPYSLDVAFDLDSRRLRQATEFSRTTSAARSVGADGEL